MGSGKEGPEVERVGQIARTIPDFHGGIAGNNREGGHILGHHRPGTDHGSFTDFDSRQDDGAISDPNMITDLHRSAFVFEAGRTGIVAECQDRGLGTDRDVFSDMDREMAAVKEATKVDDVLRPQRNFSPIQESTIHLHASPGAKCSKPCLQVTVT